MTEMAFNYKYFSGTLVSVFPRGGYRSNYPSGVTYKLIKRDGTEIEFADYPTAQKEFYAYMKECEKLDELIDTED